MYKSLNDNKGKKQLCFDLKSLVGFWNMSIILKDRKHSSIFSHS